MYKESLFFSTPLPEFSILTLVLNRKEPDLELEGLLKRHSTTVRFYQGSIMSAVDLARVKVIAEFAEWPETQRTSIW